MPEVRVEASRYTVSVVPEGMVQARLWQIEVEYRGENRWAVVHMRWCLGTDGEWEYEPIPSERDQEWLAEHRFDLETALRLAQEAAPDVVVNGVTAREAAQRWGGGSGG